MSQAENWVDGRNLQLTGGRETLIYLLSRSVREHLPEELLVYMVEKLYENRNLPQPAWN